MLLLSGDSKRENLQKKFQEILEKKSFQSPFLIPFSLADFPLDIRLRFSGYEKYVLEIGSGWGEFGLEYAYQNPKHFILGLEKKKKRILRTIRRQDERKLENAAWMLLNISWFFKEIFTRESFDKIIVNFPDPWPKKRHHKHRFMDGKFIQNLADISQKGALLEFVSDDWNYVEEALSLLEKSQVWSNLNGEGVILKKIEGRFRSFFETTQREKGESIYYLQFVSKAHFSQR